jgi:hypothetical protein
MLSEDSVRGHGWWAPKPLSHQVAEATAWPATKPETLEARER